MLSACSVLVNAMPFGFFAAYKRAQDTTLPLTHRWYNLKRCVARHAILIEQSYGGTLARLCATRDMHVNATWIDYTQLSVEQMEELLTITVMERAAFIKKYHTFVGDVRKVKHRQAHLLSTLRRQLYAPTYYTKGCVPLAPLCERGKYGYITSAGVFALVPQYERAEPFVGTYAAVRQDGKWSRITTQGHT